MISIIRNLLRSPYFIFYGLITILFILGSGFRIVRQPLKISFEEALDLIFSEYPEIMDQGEAQRYFSEQIGESWYISVAYISTNNAIEGGDCFRVTGKDVVYLNNIQIDSSFPTKVNPVTCRAK